MTSPTGGNSPDSPDASQNQPCPHCDALIDISECEPLEVVDCPNCGQKVAVSAQISHYQIVKAAGRGGMGVVYKAYDPSLERYIALKLLKKSASSDSQLIELENEAEITASINDPNVVRVYGTGRDRGRFFLAMELVENGSLDDLIHLQGRVAETQVLSVGIQIARGLNAALQRGLIHRDVKPGNILFGDAHTAKIADFGLALSMTEAATASGEVMGTPYYIAPEKLDQQPEDFRSDIYSLGATLFHALAGRPPFEAQTATLVAFKHLKSQAVRVQSFAPWVSNATAHIIDRTLAKNPADRFQSYEDLIHNLEYALEELEKNGTAPQSRARVVMDSEGDQKVWTWVVLGMAAVIVVLIGVFFVAGRKPPVSGNAPVAVEKKSANLEKAIEALSKRSPEAPENFEKLANNTSIPPTDRAWAQFLAGVSHLVLHHPMEARSAFDRVEPLTSRMKDETLAKFLRETAQRLAKPEVIDKGETKALSRSNYEAIALLAYGLHNWDLGQAEDGAELLREFRKSKATSAEWLNPLAPLPTAYLEELTLFNMEMERLKTAKTPAQRTAIAEKLKDLTPALKTRLDAELKSHQNETHANEPVDARNLPEPGLFRLINHSNGKSAEVPEFATLSGAAVVPGDYVGQSNQVWELAPQPAGIYRVRPFHTQTRLDVLKGSLDDGAPIDVANPSDSTAQNWKIEPQSGGLFRIRSVLSNKLLSLGAPNNGKPMLVQRGDDAGPDQLWKIERVAPRLNLDWFKIGVPDPADKVEIVNSEVVLSGRASSTFVTREAVGDFDLVVRAVNINAALAGFGIRSSVTPNAMTALIAVTPAGLVQTWNSKSAAGWKSYPTEKQAFPCWLKLERRGATLTNSCSPDGNTWHQVASDNLPFSPHVFVTFAQNSGSGTATASARYDHLTFTKK